MQRQEGDDASSRDAVPSADAPQPSIEVRDSSGFQIGDGNVQHVYYIYGSRTWADKAAQPPLASLTSIGIGHVESPYRGLAAFEEGDAEFFYGREQAAAHVLEHLSRAARGRGTLMVSGDSGAGKSSLLRAGVLPRIHSAGLEGNPGAASWPCLVFTPGGSPLSKLATYAATLAGIDGATTRQALAENPADFALTAHQVLLRPHAELGLTEELTRGSGRRLLLIIDQFEQLFTQCAVERDRVAFLAALDAATTTSLDAGATPPALAVLVVRADFESRCADYQVLADAVQNRYLVTAMTSLQLRLAITKPAEKVGSGVDQDLVRQLLDDMHGDAAGVAAAGPGTSSAAGLPLLSHVLDKAWRSREGGPLTLLDYERAGGLAGALSDSAQRAYDRLGPSQQTAARQVFLRLTATSADGADTADRASYADLLEAARPASDDDVRAVLDAFTSERLLTWSAEAVEISHEVLLRAWGLLRDGWLAQTHSDRVVRTRLRGTAREWHDAGRDPSYLYTGKVLATAADAASRATSTRLPLGGLEQEFLRASEASARRRRRRFAGVAALLLGLAAGLTAIAVVAYQAQANGGHQHDVAVASQLAAHSTALADSDPLGSRVTGLAAWHIDPDAQTWQAVLGAAADAGLRVLPSRGGGVSSVAFNPSGTVLAAGAADGTVQTWGAATGQPDGNPVSAGAGASDVVAFSRDGRLMAAGGANGMVVLWDATVRRVIARLSGTDPNAVESLSFSPSGTLLAVAHGDRKVWVWDLATDQLALTQPLPGSSAAFSPSGQTLAAGGNVYPPSGGDYVTQLYAVPGFRSIGGPLTSRYDVNPEFPVAFSPDGRLLAAPGGSDGTVSLWDTATGKLTRQMNVNSSGSVNTVAFSPDGQVLAAGLDNGDVSLWETETGRQEGSALTGHSGIVSTVAFSPDGRTLASGSDDGTVRLWNVTSQVYRTVASSAGLLGDAQFSRDGRTLFTTGYGAGGVLRWDVATGRRTGPAIPGIHVALSPDGRTLAAADDDRVYLWNTATDRRSTWYVPESNIGGGSDAVAFSPDGRVLATADTEGYLQLWNLATGQPTGKLMRVSGQVDSIAFSPSGHLIAVGSEDGSITLWNTATHDEVGVPLTTRASLVSDVVFSPSGNLLASASDTGMAQLWDVSTRRQVGSSMGDGTSAVFSVAFSPDGQMLATGSHDGTIQLWDTATYQQIGPPLTDHYGEVYSVAFSPSGQSLAAVTDNGARALLWDVSGVDDALRTACGQIGGAVTPAQWRQYVPTGPTYSGACPRP